MSMKRRSCLLAAASCLLLAACESSSRDLAKSTQVVARVNDKEITTSYVQRRLSNLSALLRKKLRNEKRLQEFIDSLVAKELLLQAAREAKLDKSAAFVNRVRDYKKDLLAQLFVQKKLMEEKIRVSDQEVQDYYQSHQDDFKGQPELRLSNIFLVSEVQARDVLKQIKAGEDFAKLAREKSANRATAARGGDMGFLRKWQLPATVAGEIFSLKPGQVSDIIPSEFGYTIVKVTDERMGEDVPLEKVAAAIKRKLFREKQRRVVQQMVRELKKKARITINESVVASLGLALPETEIQKSKSGE